MINSTTVATTQDRRVSTDEGNVGCCVNVASRIGLSVSPPARPYRTARSGAKANEENSSLICQSIEHGSLLAAFLTSSAADRNPDKRQAQPDHAVVREFLPANTISLAKERGVRASSPGGDNMHRHLSKLVPLALVAAIGVGLPALAKSIQSRKHVASRDTRDRDAQRVRGLSSGGSLRRAPTFGVPNPNSPALAGGHGYNANLYVY